MQRCGSSHGNTLGPCPCNGPFHTQPNSFSMLFSPPPFDHEPSSSAVDCTLSLGTPSTRGLPTADVDKRVQNRACMNNLCWDLLQVKHAPFQPQSGYTCARGGCNGLNGDGGDSLLVRRCANCDTTSTPLWRNGPRGPKSLCNACGIRFKKEERRAAGASGGSAATSGAMWVPLPQSQKPPCFSPAIGTEFSLTGGEDSGPGVPFLSWRLNVTDRPSLVHDFTR